MFFFVLKHIFYNIGQNVTQNDDFIVKFFSFSIYLT